MIFKRIISLFFLFALVFTVYSNTFNSSWHLDDRPVIINNYFLHLDSLHPDKLINTFYTDTHNPDKLKKRMYRPVPCLSFALNWYFGKDNVFGYHIVNIAIHCFTTFFLLLFTTNLFSTPKLKNKHQDNRFFIALITSLLWALNPIQTQAVTYIVQRMAELSAMFYILSLYAYLKGRLNRSFYKRIIWFVSCFFLFLFAVNSKPNAAMLPMAIVLLEIIFFQNLADPKTRLKVFLIVLGACMSIIIFGTFFFLNGNPLSLLHYDGRTFTLVERLLAQPRVVVFYLSQIFYPAPDRLSIAHDIILSSSFLKPWTTIPSILIIVLLIGGALSQIVKRPLFAFAILFFFLNHIIESSIIPLEIIFEHRNYLPSFFLFLPVACLLDTILINYKTKNKLIYFFTLFLTIFLITTFSVNTFIRNQAWKNDITLWTDAVSKAPNNTRALNILAIKLAWGNNSTHPKRYDMALKLFKESLTKHFPSNHLKADILGNMATIYFYHKDNREKAIELYYKALKATTGNLKIRRDLTNALILSKNFEEANKHVDILITKNKNNGIYLNLKGHILLWQGKYGESIEYFNKAYVLLFDKESVLLNSSVALSLSGYHKKAAILLEAAINQFPNQLTYHFALIENSVRSKNIDEVGRHKQRLFLQFDNHKIQQGLETLTDNPRFAPISKKLIAPVIENML